MTKKQDGMRKLWKSRMGVLGENRMVDPKTFALRRDTLLGVNDASASTDDESVDPVVVKAAPVIDYGFVPDTDDYGFVPDKPNK